MTRTADFFLELRSEELPARMQDGARAELAKLFAAELAKTGLMAVRVETFATPRRLVLIAHDLPLETQAVSEEIKGPKTTAPPQALEGFLRKTGLSHDQLEARDGVYFAVINKPGRKTADVLAEAIPAIVRGFSWPKSMRWGAASAATESLRWVRPLQTIIALLGDEVVPCAVDGIASGRETMGHRFHHSGAITITNAGTYAQQLRAAHVIVDQAERQDMIRAGAAKVAAGAGFTLIADEALVVENAGLTEWPVPLLGHFDAAFLAVPPEVIRLSAKLNQKYFMCEDAHGKLANAFVCTANIAAHDGGKAIIAGNERVLAARLSDAQFFYEQDLKTRLAVHAEKLKSIVFREKLGTMADKVERVANLARWLVESGVIKGASAEEAEQAAQLCKADLVTGMVGEFPELQGVMGGYYARAEGLPSAVADAIRDHYKPVGQGDDVPTAPVTVAVSLADKLDTLVMFFVIGEAPTGSRDPFALRRAALAGAQLSLTNGLRFSLGKAVTRAFSILKDQGFSHDESRLLELVDFIIYRVKIQQRELGVRHDLIDAAYELGYLEKIDDDLVRLLARVRALQAFIETPDGVNLLAGYKRAAKILRQAGDVPPATAPADLAEADTALLTALGAAEPRAQAAIEAEDFALAMSVLATLRAPIDQFFADVMVNDPDPEIRAFRLGLLDRFRVAVHKVADFSKIEG